MKDLGFDRGKLDDYFEGKNNLTDKNFIEELFSDEDNDSVLRDHLKKQWDKLMHEPENGNVNLDHILHKIHYNINTHPESRKRSQVIGNIIKWSARIAAVLMLPLAVYFALKLNGQPSSGKLSWVEINAPAWTRARFSLPDGTTGWLNSNSTLRYNADYIKDRKLFLEGEAYLEVFRDEKRPLSVMTKDIVVKVLGTKFNISSYSDENSVEVVLEEGKLIFSDPEMNKSYTMEPNELVVYDKISRDFSAEKVQPQKYLSWKEGRLVFRNDPLDIIARRLGRWYNVDVEIIGPVSNDLRLRATFLDENLEEVMRLLEKSLKIDYIILDRNIISGEIYTRRKVIITQDLVNTNI